MCRILTVIGFLGTRKGLPKRSGMPWIDSVTYWAVQGLAIVKEIVLRTFVASYHIGKIGFLMLLD